MNLVFEGVTVLRFMSEGWLLHPLCYLIYQDHNTRESQREATTFRTNAASIGSCWAVSQHGCWSLCSCGWIHRGGPSRTPARDVGGLPGGQSCRLNAIKTHRQAQKLKASVKTLWDCQHLKYKLSHLHIFCFLYAACNFVFRKRWAIDYHAYFYLCFWLCVCVHMCSCMCTWVFKLIANLALLFECYMFWWVQGAVYNSRLQSVTWVVRHQLPPVILSIRLPWWELHDNCCLPSLKCFW